jgi:hypothetical protein
MFEPYVTLFQKIVAAWARGRRGARLALILGASTLVLAPNLLTVLHWL